MSIPVWLDQLVQDVRYARRTLGRSPGFTTAVVLTLAFGIGMNTAIFSAVDAVLFGALKLPDAGRLVWLAKYDKFYMPELEVRVPSDQYSAFRAQSRSFAGMAGFAHDDLAMMASGEATEERIASITGDFWRMTGARPAAGHLFAVDEPHAIVLTHALVVRRFGGNAHIVGRSVTLNGYPFTVVGILDAQYRFPFPQQLFAGDEKRDIDAFIPVPPEALTAGLMNWRVFDALQQRVGPVPLSLGVVGKLRPGVTLDQARTEIGGMFARMDAAGPAIFRGHTGIRMTMLKDRITAGARRALMVLAGAVAFVLLIACANVANLLLARGSARRRETAVRGSLGAGRGRLARQLLTESVTLALLGGAAGLLLARWALTILIRLGASAVERLNFAHLDARVLLFTLAISVLAGLLFGMAPLVSIRHEDLHAALKTESGTSSTGRGQLRYRGVLTATELALAMVLLTGAGLMLKSFWQMSASPMRVDRGKILIMNVSLRSPQYSGSWPKQSLLLQAVLDRLGAMPGVAAVGLDCGVLHTSIGLTGTGRRTEVALRAVSPGYLQVLGVPLIEGHRPSNSEELSEFSVNEALARQIDGGRDPLGKRMQGSFLSQRIGAIVSDFKETQLDREATPEVYMAYQFLPNISFVKVLVRSTNAPTALLPAIRRTMRDIDPAQPVFDVQTLEQAQAESIAPRRFNMFLLEIFAVAALVLAIVGIYGMVAYSVAQRTHEIGIRMSLGAGRNQVLGMILREGALVAATGIAAGLLLAQGLTRLMANLLYRVSPNDPATFAVISAALAITALGACFGPALKAARVDLLAALRHD